MKTFAVALAAGAAALASAEPAEMDQWKRIGRAPAKTVLPITVALQEENLDKLDALFWAVSTPGNPEYGRHRSMEAVRDLTAAKPETVKGAKKLMHKAGARCALMASKSALRCKMTVSDIEQLLSTEVHTFKHAKKGAVVHRIPRTTSWRFPEGKGAQGIRFISGLTNLPVPHYGRVADATKNGEEAVVPQTLTDIYNIKVSGDSSITQAAAEFQDLGAWTNSDLSTFQSNTGESFTVSQHFGSFDQSSPQAESTLDVQYLGSVGAGNTNWYWTEAAWMYEFTQTLLANPTETPDIISMSYGWNEAEQCQIASGSSFCNSGGSQAYVEGTNTQFQKLGAAGVTLLAASGDSGAHGRTDGLCLDKTCHPAYPAASPYLTAVGATMFKAGTTTTGGSEPICSSTLSCLTGGEEIVCSNKDGALITSGGGFSLYADMPSYQKDVVTAYQANATNLCGSGNYNPAGRAFPDVAAMGHAFYIELDSETQSVDGTSCACPVFAGVLSLLNAHRVKNGGSKLGFANPVLYALQAQHPAAFNDITEGNNYCTEQVCWCTTGYTATKGWDATTGLGTPNVAEMIKGLDAMDAAMLRKQ